MRSREAAGISWESVRRRLAGFFPDRQFLIRADGRVRYIAIGGRTQAALLALAVAAAAWTAAASFRLLTYDDDLAARERQVVEDREAYQALLADVGAYERKFSSVAREIEDNRNLMLSLVEQNTALQHTLASLNGKLQEADRRFGDEKAMRQRLNAEIDRIQGELTAVAARNGTLAQNLAAMSRRLADVAEQRDRAVAERRVAEGRISQLEGNLEDLQRAKDTADSRLTENSDALNKQIADLKLELRQARDDGQKAAAVSSTRNRRIAELEGALAHMRQERETAADLTRERLETYERDIAGLQSELESRLGERDRAVQDRKRMVSAVQSLESRLSMLQGAQEDAVARMIDHTVAQIGNLEKVVGLTGLELNGLLADGGADYLGQGGPFIAAPRPEGNPGEGLQASLTALDQHMNHWEMLRDVMQRVPMAAPLGFYHVTGSYGKRRDPLNNRWAMHYGLDLGGPMKARVRATAPGKVVVAGWMGRYGRMVEIDHGAGLRTRYGHLSKVSVTKGQEVGFDEEIGLLGSSGRSTGPHLHYEVIFNGKPMDPMKFIMAGQHVFQSEQDQQ